MADEVSQSLVYAVLITCFNRREKTLTCLQALSFAAAQASIRAHVILVDDGSTDGTEDAVRQRFPDVEIIRGDGGLFWSKGMNRAFALALSGGFGGYFWLNDDTVLRPDAFSVLLSTAVKTAHEVGSATIVTGATANSLGELTYGGSVAKNRWRPFHYTKVWSPSEPVECTAMNGNFVYVPVSVAARVGNIDGEFEHALGDIDYSLRAQCVGIRTFVAPGIVGLCLENSSSGSFKDKKLPMSVRWRLLLSPKGVPVSSWYRFTKRHGGWLWPLYFVWPYMRHGFI